MVTAGRILPVAALLAASAGMTGCGTPATPQPPSLKLPVPASDLTAERSGETILLRWTTPRKTTDRLLIQGVVRARVCRIPDKPPRMSSTQSCESAGELVVEPGKSAEFRGKLPAQLLGGEPRVVRYFIELRNTHGKSAGPSNSAAILAGAAPEAVTGLEAEVRADGVALHWQPAGTTAVRLHRTLLTPPVKAAKNGKNPMAPASEPLTRNLWVESSQAGTGAARELTGSLDTTARFGESYAYAAQRVARIAVDGQTLELGGPISGPVQVELTDHFPPAVPRDLAAVAAAGEQSIDLSWTPDSEPDLTGYIVYRQDGEAGPGGGWKRISGPQPVVAAAWRDTTAAPGRSYRYRVTAIDQTGNESAPSGEVREALPAQ